MALGTAIVLIAIGAVLRFAVNLNSTFGSSSVNWKIIGDILMIVGLLGLVLSLFFFNSAMPWRRRTVVEDRAVEDPRYVERVP